MLASPEKVEMGLDLYIMGLNVGFYFLLGKRKFDHQVFSAFLDDTQKWKALASVTDLQ